MVGKYSPNPLMGVEELIEMKQISLNDDCSDQELLSEVKAIVSPTIEPSEPSPDISDRNITEYSGEVDGENENMHQEAEKKKSRCKQFRDWIGRKRSCMGELLRSCLPHRNSRK